MGKVIKLTEDQLKKVIERILKEDSPETGSIGAAVGAVGDKASKDIRVLYPCTKQWNMDIGTYDESKNIMIYKYNAFFYANGRVKDFRTGTMADFSCNGKFISIPKWPGYTNPGKGV